MKPLRSAANSVAGMSISVAILVLVVLTSLGIAAPVDTHPFFYFGLILFGGGAVGLLFAGVGALFAGSRTPTVPSLDLAFFAGTRRMVLAMWLCALVTDALGVLVMLAIAGGRGSTPVGTGTVITTFAAGAVTVVCAGVTSVVMRRRLPRG
jgi:hypothetical protein